MQQGLVEVPVRNNRQNGSKDLLLHDRIRKAHRIQDGRADIQIGLVMYPANDSFFWIDKGYQSAEMPLVDYPPEVLRFCRIGAKHGQDLDRQVVDQVLGYGFMDQNIVRGNACLTCVQVFSPHNPSGAYGLCGIRKHNDR